MRQKIKGLLTRDETRPVTGCGGNATFNVLGNCGPGSVSHVSRPHRAVERGRGCTRPVTSTMVPLIDRAMRAA